MKTVKLNGKWNIRSGDGSYNLEGTVPGSLFYELEKRGDFGKEGVFYRENNKVCLDIADRDFFFSRKFLADAALAKSDQVFLEADGLDTLAVISVNGRVLAETENMHRRYRFNLSGYLTEGENHIEIQFKNALKFLRKERNRRMIFASDAGGATSVPGFNMIRKSHCSFGWDWGPKIPDVGIWKEIRIVSYAGARLNTVHVTQEHQPGKVLLNIEPETEMYQDGNHTVELNLKDPGGAVKTINLPADKAGTVTIENPELWWPNGLGEQPLYTLEFKLLNDGVCIDSENMRIGLRTLTVEQRQDEWGETFNFLCNGISIFARGGNYIPEDVYLNRNNPYSTENLIKDCIAANFNCMRVWGGGIYPSDHFFDLCDENGLIVWQDMMFACAIYDVRNDQFLENIIEEVKDNLTRIRHHACLGLICGNNEMEWGFEEWGFNPTKEERFEYLKQYQVVFPEIMRKTCPELFYWPASPSSGGDFELPNAPDKGDCHFWEVWHMNKDFSEFKKHYFRFMSEFGFESFPNSKTINSFTSVEDRNIFSPVMEEHQKCVGGNGKILTYISKYFKYPESFESLVYVSQLSQAIAIKTGIEHWRRNRGRCMGSTYWQVNDNWPVASWSSIDYYGRWKALHYKARKAYDNILLSIDGDSSTVAVHLSNESREEVSGTLAWRLINFSGDVVDSGTVSERIGSFSSQEILVRDFSAVLSENRDRNSQFESVFTLLDGQVYRDTHYFVPYKYLSLQNPGLVGEVKEDSGKFTGGKFTILIKADKPALFVEIDFEEIDVVLSDNYFDMAAGETREIGVITENLSQAVLKAQMKLRSLFDSY
ncbi:MAG: glycoside hydrolase family 2 protein [Bacteroidetes bacterium]|nr:glycoside hydrolase family 2 protein [Bacteroidota bacterium]